MIALLSKVWSVVVGVFMIVLSLFVQLNLFIIPCVAIIPSFLPSLDPRVSMPGLLILFNMVSCYEYFCKRRVVTLGGAVNKLAGLVKPDSGHLSMVFFLVPRGIDRIITGRELTR